MTYDGARGVAHCIFESSLQNDENDIAEFKCIFRIIMRYSENENVFDIVRMRMFHMVRMRMYFTK